VSAAVPATTALRWIEQLHRLGLLRKKKNPTDARMTWLDLTDEARLPLDRYFDHILANQISSNLARAA
jgi:DNA-binding MarR family transcriptional regulator